MNDLECGCSQKLAVILISHLMKHTCCKVFVQMLDKLIKLVWINIFHHPSIGLNLHDACFRVDGDEEWHLSSIKNMQSIAVQP